MKKHLIIILLITLGLINGCKSTGTNTAPSNFIKGNIFGQNGEVLTNEKALEIISSLIPNNRYISSLDTPLVTPYQTADFKLNPGSNPVQGYTKLLSGNFIDSQVIHTLGYKMVEVKTLRELINLKLLNFVLNKPGTNELLRYRIEAGNAVLSDNQSNFGAPVTVSIIDTYQPAYYNSFASEEFQSGYIYSPLVGTLGLLSDSLVTLGQTMLLDVAGNTGVITINGINEQSINAIIANSDTLKANITDTALKQFVTETVIAFTIYTDVISPALLEGFKTKLLYDDNLKEIIHFISIGNYISASNLEMAIFGEGEQKITSGRTALEKYDNNFLYGRNLYSRNLSNIRILKSPVYNLADNM